MLQKHIITNETYQSVYGLSSKRTSHPSLGHKGNQNIKNYSHIYQTNITDHEIPFSGLCFPPQHHITHCIHIVNYIKPI